MSLNIGSEQPPEDTPGGLSEWLTRFRKKVNKSFHNVHDYEVLYEEPSKLYLGMTRYFGTAIIGTNISCEGIWVYTSNGWDQNMKDFFFEIIKGNVPGHSAIHKFGRNADIDTSSGFETIWNGGGLYTGFDVIAAEIIDVRSSDAADVGTVVSSGTATGGSPTTLIDDVATFSSDGVAVGDIIINDTQLFHGIVTEVTSEITLTVFRFDREGNTKSAMPVANDAYRVVTAGSTGASVAVLEYLLDGDWANETEEYVVLNGVTGVDTTGEYTRNSRVAIVHAGSVGANVGIITSRQKITTANIFAAVAIGYNRTMISAYTIPNGKTGYINTFFGAIAGKTSAKSNIRLVARHFGEVFNVKEEFTISSAATGHVLREYKIPKDDLPPRTDIMITADSDTNNSGISGGFDLVLVDVDE